MDRIRQFADLSVRRAAGFGLLAIALVVLALHADRTLAMHALAFLLTIEAITLYCFGLHPHWVPRRRREIWLPMEGLGEKRGERMISEIMRETFMAYARRMAGPALAAWVLDLGMRLSS
ncbi:MAG: hypothetical protein H7Y60_12300 [Rhodospirillaceae bacterium]|nr:hypothetical protein [Rhodospirillales bacterium]